MVSVAVGIDYHLLADGGVGLMLDAHEALTTRHKFVTFAPSNEIDAVLKSVGLGRARAL